MKVRRGCPNEMPVFDLCALLQCVNKRREMQQQDLRRLGGSTFQMNGMPLDGCFTFTFLELLMVSSAVSISASLVRLASLQWKNQFMSVVTRGPLDGPAIIFGLMPERSVGISKVT